MLRNVIGSPVVTEIYKLDADVKRGALVTKNTATGIASKASDVGVQVYVVDYDAQTVGALSDVAVSAYDVDMDTVKANARAVLLTYPVGAQFATDQINGAFAAGDYAVAGTAGNAGLLVKATTGKVSKFKFVGDYLDGDKVLKQFEVCDPKTV
ncbi:hypothetical protein [Bacillus xiapuensis]|uniref:Uncharacterized protein n=1 Tax=Bacillus xiapuensis TaxID=2014075 RepID=A0ABU6N8P5_9BACI|nr:hypothetical protein [Bacillus xiapuensis]